MKQELRLRKFFETESKRFAEISISYQNIIKVTCWLRKDYKYLEA